MSDAPDLLAAYDAQVRDRVPDRLPKGVTVERDGPLVRFLGLAGRGFVVYRDLGGIEGADLDELIARQVRAFAERGESFEWKLHGHDRPEDLSQRLLEVGFEPEETETVVIARVAAIAAGVQLPEGVSLRDATSRADFERIAALEQAVWGHHGQETWLVEMLESERAVDPDAITIVVAESGATVVCAAWIRFEQGSEFATLWGDHGQESWLVEMLESERAADPDAITIVVAEAGATVVCAAWIRFEQGSEFATLWGGATLPEWRRRGIYRATVAHRANVAAERGFRYLEVDASDDSRPILERLGFQAVTTTTPYVWSPPTARTGDS